jgi:hypothetical protein
MTVDVSYEFRHRYVLLLVGDHFPHARYLTLFRLLCLAQFASTERFGPCGEGAKRFRPQKSF